MKIGRLRWTTYRVPFRAPYTTAQGSQTHREGLLLELITDTGLVGLGEAAPTPDSGISGDDLAGALASVGSGLIGLDIEDIVAPSPQRMPPSPSQAAPACALDTAICDLLAQERGVSLACFLRPGAPSMVEVNALVTAPDLLAATRAATAARDAGYRTIKLKVGMAEEDTEECARIAAVRKAIGPQVKLRLDPNGAWDIPRALKVLGAIGPLDVEYVEQPLPPGNLEAMAYLQERVNVSLAADEDVMDIDAARRILKSAAAQVLVLKPQRLGGLRACLQAIEIAERAGAASTVTTSIESGVGTAACLHLAAGLPPGSPASGLATASLLEHDLTSSAVEVTQGTMRLNNEPGLGVRLDSPALSKYTTGWTEAS
jgi:o-succinylbenzoate synthase